MLAFLSNLFKCRVCEAHVEAIGLMERHIADLKDERDELRAEIKLIHEKLFQAVRLTELKPIKITKEDLNPQIQQTVRSWPRLKQKLEQEHQRKPDDEKLKHWQDVNARVEAQIPELTHKVGSELKQDLEDLA